jgi:hypothetical protein
MRTQLDHPQGPVQAGACAHLHTRRATWSSGGHASIGSEWPSEQVPTAALDSARRGGARRAEGAGRGRASADEGVSEREPGEPSWKGQLNACCCCGERCTTCRPRSTQKPLSPRLAACSRPPSSIRMHTVAEPCAGTRSALDRGATAGRGGRRRPAGPSLAHRARALRRPLGACACEDRRACLAACWPLGPTCVAVEVQTAHGA